MRLFSICRSGSEHQGAVNQRHNQNPIVCKRAYWPTGGSRTFPGNEVFGQGPHPTTSGNGLPVETEVALRRDWVPRRVSLGRKLPEARTPPQVGSGRQCSGKGLGHKPCSARPRVGPPPCLKETNTEARALLRAATVCRVQATELRVGMLRRPRAPSRHPDAASSSKAATLEPKRPLIATKPAGEKSPLSDTLSEVTTLLRKRPGSQGRRDRRRPC